MKRADLNGRGVIVMKKGGKRARSTEPKVRPRKVSCLRERKPGRILQRVLERIRQEIVKANRVSDGPRVVALVLACHTVRHLRDGEDGCLWCRMFIDAQGNWIATTILETGKAPVESEAVK
jgi:hypothetical protein